MVRNMSTKSTTGMDTGQTVNTSMAGAEFVSPGWMRRKAVVDHESLDLEDVPVLEQIAYMAATGTNVLFIPDPAADSVAAFSVETSATHTGRRYDSRQLLR